MPSDRPYFGTKHADLVVDEIRAGMSAVNGIITFAGIPNLPFGGVGDSGFGRIHGADGWREFTDAHAIARQRFTAPYSQTSFRRTEKHSSKMAGMVAKLYGRPGK